MSGTEETPWEVRAASASDIFANSCDILRASIPSGGDPLAYIASTLLTDLWDRYFSVSEITEAFSAALEDLSGYAAGEDRRDESRR
jgi:hypothetical protein